MGIFVRFFGVFRLDEIQQTTPILRFAQERALRVKPMLGGALRARGKKIIKRTTEK